MRASSISLLKNVILSHTHRERILLLQLALYSHYMPRSLNGETTRSHTHIRASRDVLYAHGAHRHLLSRPYSRDAAAKKEQRERERRQMCSRSRERWHTDSLPHIPFYLARARVCVCSRTENEERWNRARAAIFGVVHDLSAELRVDKVRSRCERWDGFDVWEGENREYKGGFLVDIGPVWFLVEVVEMGLRDGD